MCSCCIAETPVENQLHLVASCHLLFVNLLPTSCFALQLLEYLCCIFVIYFPSQKSLPVGINVWKVCLSNSCSLEWQKSLPEDETLYVDVKGSS